MALETAADKTLLTLCIVHQPFDASRTPPHPRVLLGMKKRGFGEGKWNGFGGHVESGETIEEAARREVQEEAGIVVEELWKAGTLEFSFEGDATILEVHVFGSRSFHGEPTESEEMKPQWFEIDALPFHHMWADDQYWMPLFLEQKKFIGKFSFSQGHAITEWTLAEIG